MARRGSNVWLAEHLYCSETVVRRAPERVIWADGAPIRLAEPGYQPTPLDAIERAWGEQRIGDAEYQALLAAYMFGGTAE